MSQCGASSEHISKFNVTFLPQAQKNSVSSEMHGARSAISELRTSAQSKDERIKELAKVCCTLDFVPHIPVHVCLNEAEYVKSL